MPFLTWNNGTLGILPNTAGIANTPIPALAQPTLWGNGLAGPLNNPWWSYRINAVNASWLDNLYLFRIYPQTPLGDLEREQINVALADYGDVDDDILDPLVWFHTYRDTLTFSNGIGAGSREGVCLTDPNLDPPQPPPNPPLPDPLQPDVGASGMLPPGAEHRFDVAIEGIRNRFSTIDYIWCYDWSVPAGNRPASWNPPLEACIKVFGSRSLLFNKLPDWRERPPAARFAYPGDVYTSDNGKETRTTAMAEPNISEPSESDCVRFQTLVYKVDTRDETNSFYNNLFRLKHKLGAVPWAPEPLYVAANPLGAFDIVVTNFDLDYLVFESTEIVLIDKRNLQYQTRKVTGIDRASNTISVDAQWSIDIPPQHVVFHMVDYCVIDSAPSKINETDTHHSVQMRWRSV